MNAGMGRAAAVTLVAAALAATPPSAADDLHPDTDAHVRVVHVAPSLGDEHASVTVDGSRVASDIGLAGASEFQRVPSGERRVMAQFTTTSVVGSVPLTAGCYHTLLVAQLDGLRRPPRLVDVPECGIGRIPPGHAGLRLVNATADNGAVVLPLIGNAPTTPFSASGRGYVPTGPSQIELRSPGTGETVARRSVTFSSDHAYTLFYYGGGEVPLSTMVLLDAVQPPDPPSPGTPVNTGVGAGGGRANGGPPGWAVLALIPFLVRPLLARRRLGVLLAGLALLAACAPRVPGPSPPASTASPPTSETRPRQNRVVGEAPPSLGEPARIVIPAIGVDAPIVVRSSSDAANLPRLLGAREVAWLRGTTPPGDIGVSVLAGHVVSGGMPAVFGLLGQLRRGDQAVVEDEAAGSMSFTVRSASVWPKGDLPLDTYAPTPERSLLLITCIDRDPASGAHLKNLVVRATA